MHRPRPNSSHLYSGRCMLSSPLTFVETKTKELSSQIPALVVRGFKMLAMPDDVGEAMWYLPVGSAWAQRWGDSQVLLSD